MRIVYKLPLLLGLFFGLIVAMMLVHEARIVVPGLERLELDLARRDLHRVLAAVDRDLLHLSSFTRDWSQWDDTYRYVVGDNPEYVDSNLDDSTWENIAVDLVAVYGRGSRLLYSGTRDARSGKAVDAAFLPRRAPADAPFIHRGDDKRDISGLLALEDSI